MKYTSHCAYQRTLPSGKTVWVAKLRWKEGGRYRETVKTLGPRVRSKSAAWDAALKWRMEMESAEEEGRGVGSSMGLPALYGLWEEEVRKTRSIEESTVKGYKSYARRLMSLESLRGKRLRDIDENVMVDMTSELFERGLSANSVRKYCAELKRIINFAVSKKIVPSNPVDGFRKPKRKRSRPNVLPVEGRRRLVDFLKDTELTRLTVAAWIVLYCGMREGEICGLRWTGLDFGGDTVGVYGAIGRKEGGTYYKVPKSDSGFREFGMPASLKPVLLEWRLAVEKECRACGTPFNPDLFVIGYPDGSWCNPDVLSHKWTTLSETLGLVGTTGARVTFLDMRHTFATRMLQDGVDAATIASIMGEADSWVTLNHYASTDANAKRAAVGSMERVV